MPTRNVWIRYRKTVLVSLFLAAFLLSEIILKLIHTCILHISHHIVLVNKMKHFESWLFLSLGRSIKPTLLIPYNEFLFIKHAISAII
jgi:hypothetical protein